MKRSTFDTIRVFRSPLDHRRGRLVAGPISIPCSLGRAGTRRNKREGDGATPLGRFRVLGCFYRPDKGLRPRTRLPLAASRPSDGWCDDPRDRRYNQPVSLPYPARHERMWRDDHLYDVVVDLACNRGPVIKGRGSAIFLHLAWPDFSPTEGCVAVPAAMIRRLVERIGPHTHIEIVA
jgi:L,D-peptidoglycan transpeptidase YkuD (ErfK/YbiS/YcfS/YnhG family)